MKNTQNIQLRPATPDDVEPLTALSYKTIRVKYPDIIGADMVEGYIASGAVPQYYRDRNTFTRVAVLDGEVIGACALRGNAVDLMMVTLDHHRSGVGSALLSEAETILFADHGEISLESFRDNRQAVDFYAKHGWVMQEAFTDPDYGIAMVRMTKQRKD
ncbi:GNAT family N-acetyltransferase [Maricaulis salignorans]|uniref:Ribosomal protein S18 acetylase RimI n=1 Tax=Maricaulis salignorans TaxID=144026 RepID=A0A1G9PCF5_9PROT|nr:GNAT family N-acetyltransferase [Maricaulis salignorans]SDL96439.1 Ribosomal protein S18 acetylase RimI [Maricaulis salignorans]